MGKSVRQTIKELQASAKTLTLELQTKIQKDEEALISAVRKLMVTEALAVGTVVYSKRKVKAYISQVNYRVADDELTYTLSGFNANGQPSINGYSGVEETPEVLAEEKNIILLDNIETKNDFHFSHSYKSFHLRLDIKRK